MPHNVISTCPVCSGELSVTRLQCRSCGTGIEGEFNVGRFGRLGREQMALLESFLRARGNLKELERELKVSYPTVRARVDALVRALGLADGADAVPYGEEIVDGGDSTTAFDDDFGTGFDRPRGTAGQRTSTAPAEAIGADERRDILERLSRREITAEEAATLIRGAGRGARPDGRD